MCPIFVASLLLLMFVFDNAFAASVLSLLQKLQKIAVLCLWTKPLFAALLLLLLIYALLCYLLHYLLLILITAKAIILCYEDTQEIITCCSAQDLLNLCCWLGINIMILLHPFV